MPLPLIRIFGDPVLRTPAEPVTVFDDALAHLAETMIETMYAAPGVGLAAPQIGV
jgi:peptide deformylase